MVLPKWRIYYDDGETLDHRQATPQDARVHGVILIIFYTADNIRTIMRGWDWYYWNDDYNEWWGIDESGIKDRLMHNLPIRALKQGRTIGTDQYNKLFDICKKDPDFPLGGVRDKDLVGGTPTWKQGVAD